MKRTIISFLAVAAVVAGLVSCKGNSDTKYKVVVEAVNSLENGRIAWKSGEPIVMWDDSMEPVQIAVNELGEDCSMAQFTLNDSVETQGICRFVHPASMYKGNGVVAIPTKQNACMKVTDLPSYAEVAGDGTDVAFKAMTGAICLHLCTHQKVSTIKFSTEDSLNYMAGNFTVDNYPFPVLTATNGAEKSVVLTQLDKIDVSKGKDLYLVLAPNCYNSFKIELTTPQGKVCTKSLKDGKYMTVDRNVVSTINLGLTSAKDTEDLVFE